MNVAVIPARGGSKRIPRKNIRAFAGQPMIAHSILCALRSGLFDRVIVSTDDEEIGAVSRTHGAEVPFVRPRELSDDYTGTHAVVAHAVRWLHDDGDHPDAICCLYATAPFLREADLAAGLARLRSGDWDFVFAATTFGFPIFRSFRVKESGSVEMFFPEHFDTRSQDLTEALHDAGQFYWGRPDAWLDNPRLFGERSSIVKIASSRVQDIDTLEDWDRAEVLWRVLQSLEPPGGT
jgi:pseudaminic acid cytidylyltransferase